MSRSDDPFEQMRRREVARLAFKHLYEADRIFQSPINASLERMSAFILTGGSAGVSVLTRRILAVAAVAKASRNWEYALSAGNASLGDEAIKLMEWCITDEPRPAGAYQTVGERNAFLDGCEIWFALVAQLLPFCHTDTWPRKLYAFFCDPDNLWAMNSSSGSDELRVSVATFVRKWRLGARRFLPWTGGEIVSPEWKPKIASINNAIRAYELGQKYYHGESVMKDAAKAAEYFETAARLGHRDAQRDLGNLYFRGDGVPKDAAKAVEWYSKSADQGFAEAQCNLGFMYGTGDGVAKDAAKAVELYSEAAEQGHTAAQFNLGAMFLEGDGVLQDTAMAVEWWTKAAQQGYAEAQNNLGFMYARSEGITQDPVQAHSWWTLADAAGHTTARSNAVNLEKEMTPSQIDEAKQLTRQLN